MELKKTLRVAAILCILICVKVIIVFFVIPMASSHGGIPNLNPHDLYLELAQSLANGSGYRVTPDSAPTMVRGPGYPGFLALLLMMFQDGVFVARVSNMFLSTGTALIVFLLTKQLTRNRLAASISVLLVFFHPALMIVEMRPAPEPLFAFLLSLFTLILYRGHESRKSSHFAAAGLVIGMAVLVRSTATMVILTALVYSVVATRNGSTLRKTIFNNSIFLAGALVVISPWVIRNYALTGLPTFSESLVGPAWFQGLYVTDTMDQQKSFYDRSFDARNLQAEIAASSGAQFVRYRDQYWDIFPTIRDELTYNKSLINRDLQICQNRPTLCLKHVLLNLIRFWFQGMTFNGTLLNILVMVPVLLFSLVGLVWAMRRHVFVSPIVIVVSSIYLAHLPILAHARYPAPLIPLLSVLAGIAVSHFVRERRHRWLEKLRFAEEPRDDHG